MEHPEHNAHMEHMDGRTTGALAPQKAASPALIDRLADAVVEAASFGTTSPAAQTAVGEVIERIQALELIARAYAEHRADCRLGQVDHDGAVGCTCGLTTLTKAAGLYPTDGYEA